MTEGNAWAVLGLLLSTALAGCSAPAAPVDASGTLVFSRTGGVELSPSQVTWTFWLHNPGAAPSPSGRVELDVDFDHGLRHDAAWVDVAPLAGGEETAVRLVTPYYGMGHYNGSATLWVGGREVGHDLVAFERCVGEGGGSLHWAVGAGDACLLVPPDARSEPRRTAAVAIKNSIR